MKHDKDCQWEKTTIKECEFRETHNYCPHAYHKCNCDEIKAQKVREHASFIIKYEHLFKEIHADVLTTHNEPYALNTALHRFIKIHRELVLNIEVQNPELISEEKGK